LQEFFIVAGCMHPDLIPVEKAMLVPISEGAPGQLCLRYKAVIDIVDVVDLHPMPGSPPPPPSAGPSSSSAGSAPPWGGPTGRSGPSLARPREEGRPGTTLGGHPSPVQPGGQGRSFVDVVVGRSPAPTAVWEAPTSTPEPAPRLASYPCWALQGLHCPTGRSGGLASLSASARPFHLLAPSSPSEAVAHTGLVVDSPVADVVAA
jgi:hypothetical protein